MAIAHALIECISQGCISPTHSLSHSPTLSRFQHDQCPAPGGAAFLSHFGCSTGHKHREREREGEQHHTHHATLSHSSSLSPVLLSRPRGRKTSFLITPRTTSFSSTPASSVAWLKGCCCRSTLLSLLSPLYTCRVVVFIPLRVIRAYYAVWLPFTTWRQIFAWNTRGRGRTSWRIEQRMRSKERRMSRAAGSVRRLNVWQAPDLYFPIHNSTTALNSFVRIWNIQELLKPQPARRGTQGNHT